MSTSACILNPRDFGNGKVTDPNRDNWTLGKIRPVIDVLAGRKVAVVVDTQTGHTLLGVTLVRAYHGGPASGPRLVVESTYEDGKTSRTAFYLFSVGAILPMDEQITDRFKWKALEQARKEQGRALKAARAQFADEGHEDHGKWEVRLEESGATVSYERQSGDGIKRWYVSLRPAEIPA